VVGVVESELAAGGVEAEYVEVVSAKTLAPIEDLAGMEILIAIAARVGRARLIDNVVVDSRVSTHQRSTAAAV
jgi:pantothenate synthetase